MNQQPRSGSASSERRIAAQRGEMRPNSYRQIARHLERQVAQLHGLPADAIDRQTIAGRLNSIATESGAVTANRVRATMSAMFTWGMKEGLVLANPIVATNKRTEKPRERTLSNVELGLVWRALPAGDYGTIIKLLILTGQRMNEIAALRWSEIDFDRSVISLPSGRTKNGRPHEVPLSKTAQSLLAARPRSNGRELVFGEGAGPFSGLSRRKEALDKDIAAANSPLPAWYIMICGARPPPAWPSLVFSRTSSRRCKAFRRSTFASCSL
jgi:integrase